MAGRLSLAPTAVHEVGPLRQSHALEKRRGMGDGSIPRTGRTQAGPSHCFTLTSGCLYCSLEANRKEH